MLRFVGLCLVVLTGCTPSAGRKPERHEALPDVRRRLSGIVQVDAAGTATCALSEHGVVYCWGRLTAGVETLPDAPLFGMPAHRPVRIRGPRAKRISVSPQLVTMLDGDGAVYAIGEIGDGFGEWRTFRRTGVDGAKAMFKAERDFRQFAWLTTEEFMGYRHEERWPAPSGVLLDEHSPGCFGTTDSIQCEERVMEFTACPEGSTNKFRLALGSPPRQVHASSEGGCALVESGAIECASTPVVSETIGCGAGPSVSTQTRLQHRFGWSGPFEGMAVDVRSESGFGLRADGSVVHLETDEPVSGARYMVELSASTDHTCGLRGDGEVWCWGDNRYGQLGGNGRRGEASDEAGPVTRPEDFVQEMTPARAARRPSAWWMSVNVEVPAPSPCPEVVGQQVTRSTRGG